MYTNDLEVETLVELTENFVDFLNLLYENGSITKMQLKKMTEKKIDFINNVKSNNIF
ncbi:MAG: hypothetical protein N4A50_12465 [Vallitalea sp.]|nr:hypothetical protein [Vallitalea sp.]